jgi:hypothetical protein
MKRSPPFKSATGMALNCCGLAKWPSVRPRNRTAQPGLKPAKAAAASSCIRRRARRRRAGRNLKPRPAGGHRQLECPSTPRVICASSTAVQPSHHFRTHVHHRGWTAHGRSESPSSGSIRPIIAPEASLTSAIFPIPGSCVTGRVTSPPAFKRVSFRLFDIIDLHVGHPVRGIPLKRGAVRL